MILPIRFPTDASVTADEAARFRALPPADQKRAVRGLLAAGHRLLAASPKADFLRATSAAEEERFRQLVREFITRHAA